MSCLSRYTKRYRLLPSGNDKEKNNDNDIDDYNSSGAQYDASRSRWLFLYVFALCFTAFAGLAVGFSASTLRSQIFKLQSAEDENAPRVCSDPLLRREWRSLAKAEKSDYIEAVKCLNETPSVLGLNQSLYADFPWIHNRIGEYSHDAAPFLAWHRYFIHVYEGYLQRRCNYTGSLAYWDWTLDWGNITTSPVWDSNFGFGGDGNRSLGHPLFDGYCVTQGPFAMLEVPFFEDIYRPHCLLRGFETGSSLMTLGKDLSPENLDHLLRLEDYEAFNLGLENGPHIAIPRSINGDFSLHTAPFDPVFFLHHTQLDRLWWRWQQSSQERRSVEYSGKAATNSSSGASLLDSLPMGNLAPAVQVADIMSTESELLCYRYY